MKSLIRLGMTKGWFGSSKIFTTLSIVYTVAKFLSKSAGNSDKPIYSRKLQKGQVLVIQDGESQPR